MRRADVVEACVVERGFDGECPVLVKQPEEQAELRMVGNALVHEIDRDLSSVLC
jgi:hypothetical protein